MGGYWDDNGFWHNEDTGTHFPLYPLNYPVFHVFEEGGTPTIPRYDVVIFQLLEEIKKMLQTLLERTKIDK